MKNIGALLIASSALGLTGCSTATPKTAALYAPKVVVTGAQPVSTARPVMADSGQYPTFGPPITAAYKQMDDVEATRFQAQMASLNASRNAGAISEVLYKKQMAELQQLAATHGAEMQSRIGN